MHSKPAILAMDLEGVLVPEIWIGVAEQTGIEALRRTTRDEPDYDVLMRGRLEILEREGIGLDTIRTVIGGLSPLPGAVEFLAWARERTQVVILSDTFAEFAQPLMRQLGWPTLFCHSLEVTSDGRIRDYRLRMADHKRHAVAAFKDLRFRVCAVGDSYNDTTMLAEADQGFLFRPSAPVAAEFPQFPLAADHAALRELVSSFLKGD